LFSDLLFFIFHFFKEVAGTILILSLVLGLGLGSLIGPSLVSLLWLCSTPLSDRIGSQPNLILSLVLGLGLGSLIGPYLVSLLWISSTSVARSSLFWPDSSIKKGSSCDQMRTKRVPEGEVMTKRVPEFGIILQQKWWKKHYFFFDDIEHLRCMVFGLN
jgi:hypothetical protein